MLKKTIINGVVLACFGLTLGVPATTLANTTGKVFVAGDGSGNIAVIDAHTNTVADVIPIGAGTAPHNFVAGPDNTYVWVALKNTGQVAKINAFNNTLVGTFSTGGTSPVHLDISGDGNWLYVVNKDSDQVVKMRTDNGSIVATYDTATDFGNDGTLTKPHDINISPDGSRIWLTDEVADRITVLDTNLAGVTGTLAVGDRPIQLAFSVDGSQAFVSNFNSNEVSVIDVGLLSVDSAFNMGVAGMGPMGTVLDPDGSGLWLSGTGGSTVHRHSLLAGDNYSFTETTGLLQAHGLDIAADGSYLYSSVRYDNLLSQQGRDAIAVIDAATGNLVTTIQTTGLTGLDDATGLHGVLYVNAVPVPAAVWLFGSGLLGLLGVARRSKRM